jgi:citrate lyase beta subunit
MSEAPRDVALCRALLFTPGNRPDRFAKAAATGADGLILDLEDAVALSAKDAARATLVEHFRGDPRAGLGLRQVKGLRVNNVHTAAGLRDLDALAAASVVPDFVMIPKVESAFEVRLYARHLDGAQAAIPFVCLIESARGLEAALEIAHADSRVRALAFGGVDLAADLRAELAWESLLYARSRLVQAAASAGLGLLDVPHLALDDATALADECRRVKALGFTGKLAIHPRQVAPIREAFTPTAAEIDRARRMIAALEQAGGNAVEFEGKMLEGPVVRSARRMLALTQPPEQP